MRYGVQRGAAIGFLVVFGLTFVTAGSPPPKTEETAVAARVAHVFVHSEPLKPGDRLTDGGKGEPIEINSPTTLVWVDRMPDARYSHPTEYVLISAEGTRILKGGWWPVLNDKALFRDGRQMTVEFPIRLSTK